MRYRILCIKIFVGSFLGIFCFWMRFTLAEPATDTVTVQDESKISGDNVLLGHIATIEGDLSFIQKAESIVIGRIPLPGMERIFKREQIIGHLRDNGINVKNIKVVCASEVKVITDSIQFSSDDLRNIITGFIFENMPWKQDEVKLEDFSCRPIVLPKGEVAYSFLVQNNENYLGKFHAEITFTVNGAEAKKEKVAAVIRVMTPVAICAGLIERHAPLNPSDVKMEVRDLANLPKNTVIDLQSILGKRAKSSIEKGMVLRPDMFANDPDIHKGDRITIAVDKDLFRITAPGEALEDGSRGDMIRICNLTSKGKLYGCVKNSKEVEVKY